MLKDEERNKKRRLEEITREDEAQMRELKNIFQEGGVVLENDENCAVLCTRLFSALSAYESTYFTRVKFDMNYGSLQGDLSLLGFFVTAEYVAWLPIKVAEVYLLSNVVLTQALASQTLAVFSSGNPFSVVATTLQCSIPSGQSFFMITALPSIAPSDVQSCTRSAVSGFCTVSADNSFSNNAQPIAGHLTSGVVSNFSGNLANQVLLSTLLKNSFSGSTTARVNSMLYPDSDRVSSDRRIVSLSDGFENPPSNAFYWFFKSFSYKDMTLSITGTSVPSLSIVLDENNSPQYGAIPWFSGSVANSPNYLILHIYFDFRSGTPIIVSRPNSVSQEETTVTDLGKTLTWIGALVFYQVTSPVPISSVNPTLSLQWTACSNVRLVKFSGLIKQTIVTWGVAMAGIGPNTSQGKFVRTTLRMLSTDVDDDLRKRTENENDLSFRRMWPVSFLKT